VAVGETEGDGEGVVDGDGEAVSVALGLGVGLPDGVTHAHEFVLGGHALPAADLASRLGEAEAIATPPARSPTVRPMTTPSRPRK
jgi:hypothetical protein